ncbi:hypothetical protein QE152_g11384 [Popillia japonica]|uniref:Uncharacterized protein n=1 Tax=Popillia japonica TaxID=7064 RepID=A0AAW1LL75_POPJA
MWQVSSTTLFWSSLEIFLLIWSLTRLSKSCPGISPVAPTIIGIIVTRSWFHILLSSSERGKYFLISLFFLSMLCASVEGKYSTVLRRQ